MRNFLKWLFDREAVVRGMSISCGELFIAELFLIGLLVYGCSHP